MEAAPIKMPSEGMNGTEQYSLYHNKVIFIHIAEGAGWRYNDYHEEWNSMQHKTPLNLPDCTSTISRY
jgi:hypothetical protein